MVALPVTIEIYRIQSGGRQLFRSAPLVAGRYRVGRSPQSAIQLDPDDREVSNNHLILDVTPDGLAVQDHNSTNGTYLGTTRLEPGVAVPWDGRAKLRLGSYEIALAGAGAAPRAGAPGQGDVIPSEVVRAEFPQDVFTAPIMPILELRRLSSFQGEVEYLALGGGLGSFIWVDHLRIFGVPVQAIRVIGLHPVPYFNYARYCRNSQIPAERERLRSNAISTPDNIWGFPGYASREAWARLKKGDLRGLGAVMAVFGEPALAQSYTPIAGQVFSAMDREAERIGWRSMLMQGRILGMRKTDDGRYAVAWRTPGGQGRPPQNFVTVARYIQVATGYPALRFTKELQAYIVESSAADRKLVVNAYDPHDELYASLEASGRPETVIVRGRGIVASRIIQRLSEARRWNPNIAIVHNMRNPVPPDKTGRWGSSRRPVFNDVEFQPFNWPKACWGGVYRREVESADPAKRAAMFKELGGTTTAYRRDWWAIVNDGTKGGWYRKVFGNITGMSPTGPASDRKLQVTMTSGETISADFVVDCTGLIANPEESPFLKDLLRTYQLPRNRVSGPNGQQAITGVTVSNDFEIEGLRNGPGRVYAAGAITTNGPYAVVDSFLGLAYSALRSVDHLRSLGAGGVAAFGPLRSASQWWKWARRRSPDA